MQAQRVACHALLGYLGLHHAHALGSQALEDGLEVDRRVRQEVQQPDLKHDIHAGACVCKVIEAAANSETMKTSTYVRFQHCADVASRETHESHEVKRECDSAGWGVCHGGKKR